MIKKIKKIFKRRKLKPKTDLSKQKPKKKINWTNILIILTVIIILLITVYIVYKTGALESTRMYNNRLT